MTCLGISGTNWTGKSSTVRGFIARHADRAIQAVSLSDFVKRCPHPMVEKQTPDASRWIVEEVSAVLGAPVDVDLQLFDRSPLEILAFTRYAFDRENTAVDDKLISVVRNLLAQFDEVFYVPVSDEWPAGPRPRPAEIAFALLMDWYLRLVMREYSLSVVTLPWKIEDRYAVLDTYLRP